MKKKKLSLLEFTEEVNRLDQKQVNEINSKKPLFKAVSHGFDDKFLKIYFDEGLTPEEALNSINEERGV